MQISDQKPGYLNAVKVKSFKAIQDDIIVSDMNFGARTLKSGLILRNDDGKAEGIRSRWGKIFALGPNQKDYKVGQWIYIAHGRWTRGFKIEDQSGEVTLRKVDPNEILLVWEGDGEPSDEVLSDAISIEKKTR